MINEHQIINILDNGLNTDTPRPFAELSKALNCTEDEIFKSIRNLKTEGKIKRFGLVVKNRSIGYIYNAMVTLDVQDCDVDEIGLKVSEYPFVKLCYQRQRVLPVWSFNLYFMIHGKDREVVNNQIKEVLTTHQLDQYSRNILFSKQCLKQKGAFYY